MGLGAMNFCLFLFFFSLWAMWLLGLPHICAQPEPRGAMTSPAWSSIAKAVSVETKHHGRCVPGSVHSALWTRLFLFVGGGRHWPKWRIT
ncbi:hypothetical protein QBC39DRAFT_361008 [Podospora conica]|nr:hypothetical protein QBC39DRAFT_361008 [Schizothecium conicum]